MKKFISIMSLQPENQLREYHYNAVGNSRLQMDAITRFPIMTAINGYVEEGERFRMIVVLGDVGDAQRNLQLLQEEMDGMCAEKHIEPAVQIEAIPAPKDCCVSSHTEVFQSLIQTIEDDDELYACMTFGTKPLSQTLMLALQYAYRAKTNASISCVLYGQIDRSKGRDPECWEGYVYDETALVQLGEIVQILANHGNGDPLPAIKAILAL